MPRLGRESYNREADEGLDCKYEHRASHSRPRRLHAHYAIVNGFSER